MLAFRPLTRLAGLRQAAAGLGQAQFTSSAALAAADGLKPVGPAEAAREQDMQSADTDYNATPRYPNQSPEDAGQDAAAAASNAPLPSGPMDTSSVNDPAGRAEGSYQQQQNSMHIHHPGREAGVAAGGNSSGGSPQQPHVVLDMFKQSGPGGGDGSGRQSAIDQDSFTAGSGGSAAAARIDQPGSGPSGEGLEGPRNLNAGVEATNAVAGAERAMTADFAAGGDDVNPRDAAEPARVNPATELPEMGQGGSGARSSRFGDPKNPGQIGEQSMTARQTEKSTGMDPGGHGSS